MFAVRHGFPDENVDQAAQLYWEAFGHKLGLVMGPREKALAFITRVIDPTHAISALDDSAQLLGVVGFKTSKGALVGGRFQDLVAIYGLFGALWRASLLALLDREAENNRFLMDGIFVTAQARGKGIGSALLDAIAAEGKQRGYDSLRLDVINTNPRARALYERHNFTALRTKTMGPLKHIFKFDSATTMVRYL